MTSPLFLPKTKKTVLFRKMYGNMRKITLQYGLNLNRASQRGNYGRKE